MRSHRSGATQGMFMVGELQDSHRLHGRNTDGASMCDTKRWWESSREYNNKPGTNLFRAGQSGSGRFVHISDDR